MKDRRADDRAPDGPLAPQDRHQHHPHAEGGGREGHIPVDEVVQVAERAAGKGQEEPRDTPRNGLVPGRVDAHRLGLVLVVADGIDGQAETARIEPFQREEADHGEGKE